MSDRAPMSSSVRALSDVWKDFDNLRGTGIGETLEERRLIMESFVRDRILHYVFATEREKRDPWQGVGYVLDMMKIELASCKELYTDLEIRRMAGQVTAYAVEEWKKGPHESFRQGSWDEFISRYRDEAHSPDLMRANIAELIRTVKGWRGLPAVTFGISQLDEAFGGIYPGEIAVLAGPPGSMKSSLSLHAVEDFILRTDQFCCYYSLDMPREMITERLAIRECGIRERDFRLQLADGFSAATEAVRAVGRRYGERLAIKGHSVHERMTVDSLLHDVAARMPGLVVIDYLTRLKPEGKNDLEFVEPAMNKIHHFAAIYQIPFLVLAQMSRASRQDQAAGRIGGHSRGGGVVEELAYTEIELQKLYMPEGETMEGDNDPIIASVAKARHGVAGRSYFLEKNGELMRFTGKAMRVVRTGRAKVTFETSQSYIDMLRSGQ